MPRSKKFRFRIADPPVLNLERLSPILLLLLLSLAALTFHMIRIQFSQAVDFSLDWNLLLSWIPLLLAFAASSLGKRFGRLPFITFILSVLWLAFFPNAPYMITDLVHLSADFGRDLTWHDMIMLFYYAQVSLINGLVSLYWIHRSWQINYSKTIGNLLMLASLPLAGFGVYLGRIQRWNSWDVLHNLEDLASSIVESSTDRTALLLSFEFALLIGMLYLMLWAVLRFRTRIYKK